jgi:hypothetical protein
VVVTVAQRAAIERAAIVAAEVGAMKVARNHSKFKKNLVNKKGGTGRLGLSSANKSSNRLKQVIEEDEYIGDVFGSVAFATTQYNVNIGQSATFPWASKIASLFEKYHFDMLEFYYRREVSEYATNGQSGKVMLSFDYDASDPPPSSKQQVLDTVPHADAMPCAPTIKLNINTNEMKSQDGWYVRTGAQPANTDIKTYDCGVLSVSTYGCANTTAVGELRVRYRCTLHVPVLEAPGGPANQAGSYFEITSNITGEAAAATTVYGVQFASATTPNIIANSIQATVSTTGLITLLPGVYKIESCSACTDPNASVSALAWKLCQGVTSNTNVVFIGSVGGTSYVNEATGAYTGFQTGASPIVWSTVQWGLTLTYQVAATYSTGIANNNSYLKITTL